MRHEDVKEQNKIKFPSYPEENLFLKCSSDSFLLKGKCISPCIRFLPAAIRRYFARLSENVTRTSDAFNDMSSYFDMSSLSLAAW